jgi:hypothetical protein
VAVDNYDNLIERLTAILSESAARRTKARLRGQRAAKPGQAPTSPKKPSKGSGLAAA